MTGTVRRYSLANTPVARAAHVRAANWS